MGCTNNPKDKNHPKDPSLVVAVLNYSIRWGKERLWSYFQLKKHCE